MASNVGSFSINVVGELTKTNYMGDFDAKVHLSHRDQLAKDAKRRELLGDVRPELATERALNQATILADLYVRITKAPDFWRASNGGLDLLDDEIVGEVYKKCADLTDKALTSLQKEAEAAQKDLREEVKP